MGWSEYDDDDHDRIEHRGGKRHKRFEEDENSDNRQKRSGKRFHRRKTLKDQEWPDDDHRSSPKRR